MVVLNEKFRNARNSINTHKQSLVKIEEDNKKLLSLLMLSEISINEFKDRMAMNNRKIDKTKISLKEAITRLDEVNADINKSKIKAV